MLQGGQQDALVLDGHVAFIGRTALLILAGGIDGECFAQIVKDAEIVNNETVHFQPVLSVTEDTVGTCDRLHQSVVAHRFVEIDGGQAGYVEAGHPHGTHEDDAQGISGRLKHAFQVLFFYASAVRLNIQPFCLELGFFILL